MTYTTQIGPSSEDGWLFGENAESGSVVLVCDSCGAVVGNTEAHDVFHEQILTHLEYTDRLARIAGTIVSDLNGVIEHFGLEDWELGRP